MRRNRRAKNASDENEKNDVERKTFKHVEQHDQFDFDKQQSKTLEKNRKTESASNENKKKNAEQEIFKHAKQHD